jgi:hypothetical protein
MGLIDSSAVYPTDFFLNYGTLADKKLHNRIKYSTNNAWRKISVGTVIIYSLLILIFDVIDFLYNDHLSCSKY